MSSGQPGLSRSRGIFPGSGGLQRIPPRPIPGGEASGELRDGIKGTGERGIRRDPPPSRLIGNGGGSLDRPPPQKTGTLRRGNRRELGGAGPEFRAGAGVFRVKHWRRVKSRGLG